MAPTPHCDFGARLRVAREGKELTQEDVARRLGVGLRVYQRWETGHVAPQAANFVRLAAALGTTAEALYPAATPAAEAA